MKEFHHISAGLRAEEIDFMGGFSYNTGRGGGMEVFSREELARYDGKEGRPAYIAFMGLVYDVSASLLWKNGEHQAAHRAGTDLSKELSRAPHGAGIFGKFKAVGRYQEK
jgi:predicted heme/steroid binding protein